MERKETLVWGPVAPSLGTVGYLWRNWTTRYSVTWWWKVKLRDTSVSSCSECEGLGVRCGTCWDGVMSSDLMRNIIPGDHAENTQIHAAEGLGRESDLILLLSWEGSLEPPDMRWDSCYRYHYYQALSCPPPEACHCVKTTENRESVSWILWTECRA